MPALLLPLLLLGCQAETLSQSWQIDRTRILAAAAEPAEPRPGDTVTFSALVVHPEFSIASVIWFGCLATEASSYGCDLSGLEELFSGDIEDIDPKEIDWEALQDAGLIGIEPFLPPSYVVPADLLDGLTEEQRAEGTNLLVTLSAMPAVEGREIDEDLDPEVAYKRFPISEAATPNHNPVIDHIEVDNWPVEAGGVLTLTRDQTYNLDVVLTEDSIEDYIYVGEDGEETRTEEPYFTWYVTHGTPAQPYTLYPYGVDYTADAEGDEPVDANLWVVVRDRRGGMAWWTQALKIQ